MSRNANEYGRLSAAASAFRGDKPSQRTGAGGQGEAGAGAGEGACSGAMAVGAGRGAGFFFGGAGLRAAAGGAPVCSSTNTGFGTRRGGAVSPSVLASRGSFEATTRTGTVCG